MHAVSLQWLSFTSSPDEPLVVSFVKKKNKTRILCYNCGGSEFAKNINIRVCAILPFTAETARFYLAFMYNVWHDAAKNCEFFDRSLLSNKFLFCVFFLWNQYATIKSIKR